MKRVFSTLVDIDGIAREVAIFEGPDGTLEAELEGKRFSIASGRAKTSSKAQRLFLDGDTLDFGVDRQADGYDIIIDGTIYEAKVSDPRAAKYSALVKPPAGASREEIKAPMPGMIVSVLVKAGDEVAKGQTVLTLNAMKLENDIRATKGGVVQEVYIEPDQAVEKGTKLMLIE